MKRKLFANEPRGYSESAADVLKQPEQVAYDVITEPVTGLPMPAAEIGGIRLTVSERTGDCLYRRGFRQATRLFLPPRPSFGRLAQDHWSRPRRSRHW